MRPSPTQNEPTCCSKGGTLLQILASRLGSKIRRQLPENPLIVGILGAGSELSDRVARELRLPHHNLCLRSVHWPPGHNGSLHSTAIGAVSGCTDIIYLDKAAIAQTGASEEAIMAHVQSVKLECMQEAVSKGITLSHKNWNRRAVLLTCCTHASPALIEAAIQIIKLKCAQAVSLVVPFLSGEIKKTLNNRVNSFITLKEFEKSNLLSQYSEDLSHLDAPQIKASLEQS